MSGASPLGEGAAPAWASPADAPDVLLHDNLLLSRALEAVRRGRLEDAEALIESHSTRLTMGQVFRLYQTELETRALQLQESQLHIERSLDWFAGLFRLLPVAAVLVDKVGLICDANARALEELALAKAMRALPVPLRRLMASSDAERRLAVLLSQLQPGETVAMDDVALRTLEGQDRWADLRITQVPARSGGAEDKPLYLCVFSDRTARVETQMAREAVARAEHERDLAEAANRAKTQLLSRVSHELRTPLNAVLGFSELMLMQPSGLDPGAQSRLGHIRAAGKHLLALVDEVLLMNRADAGRMQFDLQPVELGPLVRDVLAMQEPMAAEMALSMRVEAEQRAVARADPRRTWEVLQNLVSNAIKYNRRNGQVVLRLGSDERHAWVEVADTGLGLSSEQQAHLFEPFNRLGADQMKVEGSGLGLAIARAMAHAMDGSLEVRSELGLGSTFTLRLPRSAGD